MPSWDNESIFITPTPVKDWQVIDWGGWGTVLPPDIVWPPADIPPMIQVEWPHEPPPVVPPPAIEFPKFDFSGLDIPPPDQGWLDYLGRHALEIPPIRFGDAERNAEFNECMARLRAEYERTKEGGDEQGSQGRGEAGPAAEGKLGEGAATPHQDPREGPGGA